MESVSPSLQARRRFFGPKFADLFFRRGTLLFALVLPALILILAGILGEAAWPALRHFGWAFLTSTIWDPVKEHFGILFAIFGTLYSSLLALIIAIPISLGTALFLSELAPKWLRDPISFLVELLAAVPSIIYGFWGLVVLVPLIQRYQIWALLHQRENVPLLAFTSPTGVSMLAAGVVLAIMILPYITAVSREVILAVPPTQREAAYALGATRWEAISGPVLRYARSGILGAIILGLGRALGETMAVTMVIGNNKVVSGSLLSPRVDPAQLAGQRVQRSIDQTHCTWRRWSPPR